MTNLTHNSFLCVCFDSQHVSSNIVLIIRRINFISTISGICHSVSVTVLCAGRHDVSLVASCRYGSDMTFVINWD